MHVATGYHDKGPGAWAESISLCTEHHRTISLVGDLASNLAFHSRAMPISTLTQARPTVLRVAKELRRSVLTPFVCVTASTAACGPVRLEQNIRRYRCLGWRQHAD